MRTNLDKLKYDDVWNIILYALYKMTNDPKYSTLSELIYALDKDSLLNLCATYGGCTFKVPTKIELLTLINALVFYKEVNIEHINFQEAFSKIDFERLDKKSFLKAYNAIVEVLKDYD